MVENAVKGTVLAIAGDNLGSHFIGGFCESFQFKITIVATVSAVNMRLLKSHPTLKECIEPSKHTLMQHSFYSKVMLSQFRGSNLILPLMLCPSFMLLTLGCPPCLGHDLFEGVVDYD